MSFLLHHIAPEFVHEHTSFIALVARGDSHGPSSHGVKMIFFNAVLIELMNKISKATSVFFYLSGQDFYYLSNNRNVTNVIQSTLSNALVYKLSLMKNIR